MVKVNQGLYRFNVTLTDGSVHTILKRCKTLKGIKAYMTRWTKLNCEFYGLEWTHNEWKWMEE